MVKLDLNLYMLKQQFGTNVTLKSLNPLTYNIATGVSTPTYTTTTFVGILLPDQMNISFLSQRYEGKFIRGDRLLIVEKKDATLSIGMEIQFDSLTWSIIELDYYPESQAYTCVIRRTV